MNQTYTVSSANYCYYKTGWIHPDRIMKEHDLIYLFQGSWEIWEEDTPYRLLPGDVLFLQAGRHHYGKVPCADGTRTMYIHLSGDALSFGQNPVPTLMHCKNNPRIQTLFEEIIQTCWAQSALREEKMSLLCNLLCCELTENARYSHDTDNLLEQIRLLVQKTPDRFFTASELAEGLFLSERTLRNKFKSLYDLTPLQVQMEIKLQVAGTYIRNYPNMTLREIAANLGFYDEFYFSKKFKEHYGVSPSVYRTVLPEALPGR